MSVMTYRADTLLMYCMPGRATERGAAIPRVCLPEPLPEHTPCDICSCTNWHAEPQPATICTVFLLGAAVETTFPAFMCGTAGCTGVLSADGGEYAILRQTAKHAFGYELLYDWADKTGAGGAPWFTFWRDVLQRYAFYQPH